MNPLKLPNLFGERKKGDVVTIEGVNHRNAVRARYLGSGRFTKAFKTDKCVLLFTFHGDHCKNILTRCPANPHLPKIVYWGELGTLAEVYRTTFYAVNPLFNSSQNKIIGELIAARKLIAKSKGAQANADTFNWNFLRLIEHRVPKSIQLALEHVVVAAKYWSNYYRLDSFKGSNLGSDGNGNIIFIDPVFDTQLLDEDNRRRIAAIRKPSGPKVLNNICDYN